MEAFSSEAISSIIGRIYQSAHEPSGWQDTVDEIRSAFDCSRVCIANADSSAWQSVCSVKDDEFNSPESYAAHSRDPLMPASLSNPLGVLYRRHQIIDEAEFLKRELWNEWMRPRDMWENMACNLYIDDASHLHIHLHRGQNQSAFTDSHVRAFRICLDHMIRAAKIGREIHSAARFGKLFAELPIGVALVDGAGKLEFVNNEAERLLSEAACITARAGRLVCAQQNENAKLGALIASATAGDAETGCGGTLVVHANADAEPLHLVVSVAPFTGPELYGLPARRSAIVLLRDVFMQASGGLEPHMQQVFGLTATEARLSLALATGMTLQEAAARHGITVKTARTYLERIFAKTATRQQSQLVTLIKGARPLL